MCKNRQNLRNASYHSELNTLSSNLISKNIKIIIYGSIILHVVLFGCETWCLTLWEKHRPRNILGPKKNKVAEEWRRVYEGEL
jgi:hypothetical protein